MNWSSRKLFIKMVPNGSEQFTLATSRLSMLILIMTIPMRNEGPLFISEKILLSHEPVYGLSWCLNIHGHDHNGIEPYAEGCKHLNLAANVCGYTPVSLGQLIKEGILSDISSIHRQTMLSIHRPASVDDLTDLRNQLAKDQKEIR